MSEQSDVQEPGQTNEVEVTATLDEVDQGVTFSIDLVQNENRLVIRLRDDFQFSM